MSLHSESEPTVLECAFPTANGRDVTLETFHSKLTELQFVSSSVMKTYLSCFVSFVDVLTFLSIFSILAMDPKTQDELSEIITRGNAGVMVIRDRQHVKRISTIKQIEPVFDSEKLDLDEKQIGLR